MVKRFCYIAKKNGVRLAHLMYVINSHDKRVRPNTTVYFWTTLYRNDQCNYNSDWNKQWVFNNQQ